jgi:hypothetical protein
MGLSNIPLFFYVRYTILRSEAGINVRYGTPRPIQSMDENRIDPDD